jgi:hypothetical protein
MPFLPLFAHPPSEFSDSETALETVTVESPAGDPIDEAASASQELVRKEASSAGRCCVPAS